MSDQISEILRGYLVRCGNPDSRQELSERLLTEGMTETKLRLICETMEGRGKPEAETAAMIGQVLKTKEGWQEFVGDLEFAAKARKGRKVPGRRGTGPMVNMPIDLEAEPRRRRAALKVHVVERVMIDGWTPEEVAAHIGEPIEAVEQMLEQAMDHLPMEAGGGA